MTVFLNWFFIRWETGMNSVLIIMHETRLNENCFQEKNSKEKEHAAHAAGKTMKVSRKT